MSIDKVAGVRGDISDMLAKMREVSTKSHVFSEVSTVSGNQGTPKSFEATLSAAKEMIGQVNKVQLDSEVIKNAFVTGDKNVSMSQVLVATQKSKLAMEGLITVRNKILEAYKEIMNMPV